MHAFKLFFFIIHSRNLKKCFFLITNNQYDDFFLFQFTEFAVSLYSNVQPSLAENVIMNEVNGNHIVSKFVDRVLFRRIG